MSIRLAVLEMYLQPLLCGQALLTETIIPRIKATTPAPTASQEHSIKSGH
jgi:hypothetical protein